MLLNGSPQTSLSSWPHPPLLLEAPALPPNAQTVRFTKHCPGSFLLLPSQEPSRPFNQQKLRFKYGFRGVFSGSLTWQVHPPRKACREPGRGGTWEFQSPAPPGAGGGRWRHSQKRRNIATALGHSMSSNKPEAPGEGSDLNSLTVTGLGERETGLQERHGGGRGERETQAV